MSEVRISVGSAAGATALSGWLRRDPSVARSGAAIGSADPYAPPPPPGPSPVPPRPADMTGTRAAPPPPPGTMGTLDTITAVVDSTVGLLGLLVAITAWRRPSGTQAPTVRVTESDGTLVEGTAEDVLKVLRARREQEQADT
ncbi:MULTISPECIES: effector-associated constant component EACC1 [unclassified Streptomyces]|jgi:hypothetical protein|uniref:effector-associated constant component EACC1 n=1 Tax=unclassified Streptomyces TaxID=2593676 RepID=UPI00117F1E3A|nr:MULTISPECIES: hypothetical protein [unclassified Streptomyces]TRO58957.1 hypothetical protein E4K73_36520 [Streptomyces sp. IB201691-2A2]